MTPEILTPTSQEEWKLWRTKDLTSTDIAALFGLSPYCTPYELWHRKKAAAIVEIDETERMKWGTKLQDTIAAGVAEEQGWAIRRMTEYLRLPELRLGASFDFSIIEKGPFDNTPPIETGLIEIKNVDSLQFKQGWIEDKDAGTIEAPPHIELQVQHQLLVSGRAYCYLVPFVGGNKTYLIRRTPQPDIQAAILTKAAAFWASLDANTPPEPDFDRDAKVIAKIYGYAEPGKVLTDPDAALSKLAKDHWQLGADIRRLTAQRDALKAKILLAIGEAERVLGADFTISAGVVGPAHVEYDREGYRAFRVIPHKQGGWA